MSRDSCLGYTTLSDRHVTSDRQVTITTRVHSMQRAESVPTESVNKQEAFKIAECGNTVSEAVNSVRIRSSLQ